jgi:hypothetical protein
MGRVGCPGQDNRTDGAVAAYQLVGIGMPSL